MTTTRAQRTGQPNAKALERATLEKSRQGDRDPRSGRSVTHAAKDIVAATGTSIKHGLGRIPRGWMVTDKTAPGDVYRLRWDRAEIFLLTTLDTTIDLEIW